MAEPENLAEMLENHEFRRCCGGVPFRAFLFSVDPDGDDRLEVTGPLVGLYDGCLLCWGGGFLLSGVPRGLRGSCDGCGIFRGWDRAEDGFGDDVDDLLVLSLGDALVIQLTSTP